MAEKPVQIPAPKPGSRPVVVEFASAAHDLELAPSQSMGSREGSAMREASMVFQDDAAGNAVAVEELRAFCERLNSRERYGAGGKVVAVVALDIVDEEALDAYVAAVQAALTKAGGGFTARKLMIPTSTDPKVFFARYASLLEGLSTPSELKVVLYVDMKRRPGPPPHPNDVGAVVRQLEAFVSLTPSARNAPNGVVLLQNLDYVGFALRTGKIGTRSSNESSELDHAAGRIALGLCDVREGTGATELESQTHRLGLHLVNAIQEKSAKTRVCVVDFSDGSQPANSIPMALPNFSGHKYARGEAPGGNRWAADVFCGTITQSSDMEEGMRRVRVELQRILTDASGAIASAEAQSFTVDKVLLAEFMTVAHLFVDTLSCRGRLDAALGQVRKKFLDALTDCSTAWFEAATASAVAADAPRIRLALSRGKLLDDFRSVVTPFLIESKLKTQVEQWKGVESVHEMVKRQLRAQYQAAKETTSSHEVQKCLSNWFSVVDSLGEPYISLLAQQCRAHCEEAIARVDAIEVDNVDALGKLFAMISALIALSKNSNERIAALFQDVNPQLEKTKSRTSARLTSLADEVVALLKCPECPGRPKNEPAEPCPHPGPPLVQEERQQLSDAISKLTRMIQAPVVSELLGSSFDAVTLSYYSKVDAVVVQRFGPATLAFITNMDVGELTVRLYVVSALLNNQITRRLSDFEPLVRVLMPHRNQLIQVVKVQLFRAFAAAKQGIAQHEAAIRNGNAAPARKLDFAAVRTFLESDVAKRVYDLPVDEAAFSAFDQLLRAVKRSAQLAVEQVEGFVASPETYAKASTVRSSSKTLLQSEIRLSADQRLLEVGGEVTVPDPHDPTKQVRQSGLLATVAEYNEFLAKARERINKLLTDKVDSIIARITVGAEASLADVEDFSGFGSWIGTYDTDMRSLDNLGVDAEREPLELKCKNFFTTTVTRRAAELAVSDTSTTAAIRAAASLVANLIVPVYSLPADNVNYVALWQITRTLGQLVPVTLCNRGCLELHNEMTQFSIPSSWIASKLQAVHTGADTVRQQVQINKAASAKLAIRGDFSRALQRVAQIDLLPEQESATDFVVERAKQFLRATDVKKIYSDADLRNGVSALANASDKIKASLDEDLRALRVTVTFAVDDLKKKVLQILHADADPAASFKELQCAGALATILSPQVPSPLADVFTAFVADVTSRHCPTIQSDPAVLVDSITIIKRSLRRVKHVKAPLLKADGTAGGLCTTAEATLKGALAARVQLFAQAIRVMMLDVPVTAEDMLWKLEEVVMKSIPAAQRAQIFSQPDLDALRVEVQQNGRSMAGQAVTCVAKRDAVQLRNFVERVSHTDLVEIGNAVRRQLNEMSQMTDVSKIADSLRFVNEMLAPANAITLSKLNIRDVVTGTARALKQAMENHLQSMTRTIETAFAMISNPARDLSQAADFVDILVSTLNDQAAIALVRGKREELRSTLQSSAGIVCSRHSDAQSVKYAVRIIGPALQNRLALSEKRRDSLLHLGAGRADAAVDPLAVVRQIQQARKDCCDEKLVVEQLRLANLKEGLGLASVGVALRQSPELWALLTDSRLSPDHALPDVDMEAVVTAFVDELAADDNALSMDKNVELLRQLRDNGRNMPLVEKIISAAEAAEQRMTASALEEVDARVETFRKSQKTEDLLAVWRCAMKSHTMVKRAHEGVEHVLNAIVLRPGGYDVLEEISREIHQVRDSGGEDAAVAFKLLIAFESRFVYETKLDDAIGQLTEQTIVENLLIGRPGAKTQLSAEAQKHLLRFYADHSKEWNEDSLRYIKDNVNLSAAAMACFEAAKHADTSTGIRRLVTCLCVLFTVVRSGRQAYEMNSKGKDRRSAPHKVQVLTILFVLEAHILAIEEAAEAARRENAGMLDTVVNAVGSALGNVVKVAKNVGRSKWDPVTTHNKMIQVLTGEGKSILLGVLATYYAVHGTPVDVVCYSEYLTKRDEKDMAVFIQALSSHTPNPFEIRYRTFKQLAEESIDVVREHARAALEGREVREGNKAAPKRALLIDEADVFLQRNFYGATYDANVTIRSPQISKLVFCIYDNRAAAKFDVKATAEYKAVMSSIHEPSLKSIVDAAVEEMVRAARNPDTFTEYHADEATGRIGYEVQQEFDYNAKYSNATWLLYAQENRRRREGFGDEHVAATVGLDVPFGRYSYAELVSPDKYSVITCVTGTQDQMLDCDFEVFESDFGIKTFASNKPIYPSTFKFDVCKNLFLETDDGWFSRIVSITKEAIACKDCVVIYFYDNAQLLSFARRCAQAGADGKELLALDPSLRLWSQTSNFEVLSSVVGRAVEAGQVTLGTRAFGRGVDFRCPGPHKVVVIQTFLSSTKSEETQIKGRTARQGAEGAYFLVLKKEELRVVFDVSQSDIDACRGDMATTLALLSKRQHARSLHKVTLRASRKAAASQQDAAARQLGACLTKGSLKDRLAALQAHSSAKTSQYYLLMLDRSGSMTYTIDAENPYKVNRPSRWTWLLQSVRELRSIIEQKRSCGTNVTVDVLLFGDVPALVDLSFLDREMKTFDGWTKFSAAYDAATKQLTTRLAGQESVDVTVVFFTDGNPTPEDDPYVPAVDRMVAKHGGAITRMVGVYLNNTQSVQFTELMDRLRFREIPTYSSSADDLAELIRGFRSAGRPRMVFGA